MIIPVKCFTCGTVIADKYRFYVEEVRKKKLAKKSNSESIDIDNLGVKKIEKGGKNSSRKKARTSTKKREANTNTNNDSDSSEEITIADLGKQMTTRGMKGTAEKKHK